MSADNQKLTAFAWSVRALLLGTVFLLFVGALVTTTGSGLAVPDWPLSFGTVFPRMVGGVMFEHGHRLVAGAIGFFTLCLAVAGSLTRQPTGARRLAWLALTLVILQGLLGGLTVLLRLPPPVSVAHACLAQLFFCSLVALTLETSPSYRDVDRRIAGDEGVALRSLGVFAFVIVFVQLLLGATMRHMGAGLVIGDFPKSLGYWIPPITSPHIAINFSHRCMALVVFFTLLYYTHKLFRRSDRLPRQIKHLAMAIMTLVCLQVTLGAFTVWSGRGIIPTSLHVVNGALVLATTFASLLWVFRATGNAVTLADDGPGVTVESPPQMAMARKDWMELFKVRLVVLAVFTAGSSYWLGAGQNGESPSVLRLFAVVLGTMLMGCGGGVLNQLLEVETDAQMRRTRNRPLPAGRIDVFLAERVGGLLSLSGTLFLGLVVHPLSGLLAALAVVSYVFVYTPLKRTTSLCTLVGAVPGALPVLVGWTAATGQLDLGGWILFGILFLWQLPHFMAIAWLCKDDYERAGFPMVTVVDPTGNAAGHQALAYTLALLPVSMAPSLIGMAGTAYLCTAFLLGLGYLSAGLHLRLKPAPLQARRLLLTSVIYLPALYGALLLIR